MAVQSVLIRIHSSKSVQVTFIDAFDVNHTACTDD